MLMKNLFTNGSRFRQILLISAIIISLYLSINIQESYAEPQTKPLAINLDEIEWGPPGGGNGSPLGLRTSRQGLIRQQVDRPTTQCFQQAHILICTGTRMMSMLWLLKES